MVHQDLGKRLINQVLEKLSDVGKIEQPPKMEGRFMTTTLIPDKKKIDDYKRNLEKQKEAINIK